MFYNPWSKESSDFKDPETPPDSLPSDPFAQYIYHEELDISQYPSLARGKKPRRTIVVGDIHGHLQGFNDFLHQVRHDPAKDILVLAGDLVAKGPQTLAVIDRAIELNARCVRGNHDDKVIRWRGFLDSLSLQERNALDLQQGNLDDDEVHDEVHEDDDEEEEEDENADLDEDLRAKVPSDLHRNSEHYRIARAMTQSQYDYIRSCPLILTLPRALSVHHIPVHVVHAGIDPRRDILHQRPWVLFNVRNLLKDGTPSRKKKKGQGWARAFNRLHTKRSPKMQDFLVLYGHDAGRSLNVRTWSIGIDTGCVYGRKLTGYMVETGQLYSVDCTRNQRK
ncbi:hypothetical protein BG011_006478 [Mortierella polycephala]|uniref:Calcineurin-like phosphoesterase domain-containing protein n=1 Tax=Mortierella polycephala TaxID=41804 RepID=A0A9P6PUX1_9FUNG|nr:hypothetical protein BG011_006478 [Mortierella polycephala]